MIYEFLVSSLNRFYGAVSYIVYSMKNIEKKYLKLHVLKRKITHFELRNVCKRVNIGIPRK